MSPTGRTSKGLLEQVLSGEAEPETAAGMMGISRFELRSLLWNLLEQRVQEQGW